MAITPLMPVYPRSDVRPVRGEGAYLFGEIFGVLGQSGAGKSTLLRCVNLLERPTEGTVTVAGQELTALGEAQLRRARQRIGMVHQHFALLSSRTVAGNVAFRLRSWAPAGPNAPGG